MAEKQTVEIRLTPEQKQQVEAATGKPMEALTLRLEAPGTRAKRG